VRVRALLTSSLAPARLVPITASLLIHVVLVGTALVIVDATLPRESVFMLELTELDAPPQAAAPPPVVASPPPAPKPTKRTTPPQAVTPPEPRPATAPEPPAPSVDRPAPRVEPPAIAVIPAPPAAELTPPPPPALPAPAPSPPPAAVTTPAPVTPAPAAPVAPRPSSALAGAASTAPGESASAPADNRGGATAAPRASSGSAAAVEGVTQRAIPRGGYQYRPEYPVSARRAHIQGTTLLAVLVADDGRVADVVVKESAGHPDLDEAAAAAVRRWRFEPARRGGDAVAVWVLLPVEFRLR